MEIYHGSEKIVYKPQLKHGKTNNDFGKGFYCTDEIEKAKQWACKSNRDGYVNCYKLDIENLRVLDLTKDNYNVLNWISILLYNRTFNIENPIAKQAKKFVIDNYYVDTKKYDLVIGYRADDSYFSYAESFIDNSLSINNLQKAIHLGNLGKQIVLVSEKAFKRIRFIKADAVNASIYYHMYKDNDIKARQEYKKITINNDDVYIMDIMRKK